MKEPLTLEWIISTLKKSGINSKQIVIDRLLKMNLDTLKDFRDDVISWYKLLFLANTIAKADNKCPFEEFKKGYDNTKNIK